MPQDRSNKIGEKKYDYLFIYPFHYSSLIVSICYNFPSAWRSSFKMSFKFHLKSAGNYITQIVQLTLYFDFTFIFICWFYNCKLTAFFLSTLQNLHKFWWKSYGSFHLCFLVWYDCVRICVFLTALLLVFNKMIMMWHGMFWSCITCSFYCFLNS